MFLTQDWGWVFYGSSQQILTRFARSICYSPSHDGEKKKKKSLNSIYFDIKYFPFKNIFN